MTHIILYNSYKYIKIQKLHECSPSVKLIFTALETVVSHHVGVIFCDTADVVGAVAPREDDIYTTYVLHHHMKFAFLLHW